MPFNRSFATIILAFFVLSSAFAEDSFGMGSVGRVKFGEIVSGGGAYFIGFGQTVEIYDTNALSAGFGRSVHITGTQNGDSYAFGNGILVSGNIEGNFYAFGDNVVIKGNVKNASIFAENVEVDGNVGVLYCECGKISIKGSAEKLSGKSENVLITGTVRENNIKIEKKKSKGILEAVTDWLSGLISAIFLGFIVLKTWGKRWEDKDFKEVGTYIYGIFFIIFPVVLFVIFILSLFIAQLGSLFWAVLGAEIALFGAWLVVLFLAGIPVYEKLGDFLRVKNDYARIGIGYTICYILSFLFPVWIFVAIAGSGVLLRKIKITS